MAHDPIDDYRTWLRSWGASAKTVTIRTGVATSRLQAWGPVGTWTTGQILEWLGGANLTSKWSRATYHSCLKDFCTWAYGAGYADDNPMLDVKRGRTPRSVPKPLSDAEVETVLNGSTGKTRDWIVLGLCQGLRAHEVAKIRGEDIGERLYVCGKGEVEAFMPVHPEVREMATRYPASGYWFPAPSGGCISENTISSTVGRLFRSLGVKGSIHRCRHTFGTRLLRGGADLRYVQELMRHASPATTAGYTQVLDDELTDALSKLPALTQRRAS